MLFHELVSHADQIRNLSEYVSPENAQAINAIVGFIDNLKEENFRELEAHQSGSRAVWWSPEDFIGRMKDLNKWYEDQEMREYIRPVPSYEKAQEMLERMIDNHDCETGITWDTVDSYLFE